MKSLIRMGGLFLLLCGMGGAVYFYGFFDTSVEVPTTTILGNIFGGERVANLSLMAERQNGILFCFGVVVVGGLVMYKGRDTTTTFLGVKTQKKCPHCAEYIKAEAKICRYCQKEISL